MPHEDALFIRLTEREVLGPVSFADHFPDPAQPLVVDLGCGKGRFLRAQAAAHPDRNHLGVDRLLGRLRSIDRHARRAGLTNLRLLRFDALYTVLHLLPPASVSTYFIFFPDPWPKEKHHRHRLFQTPFMDAVARTLRPGGELHAATDHLPYFDAIARILRDDPRFHLIPAFLPSDDERTDFERRFHGRQPIARCSVRKRPAPSAGSRASPS